MSTPIEAAAREIAAAQRAKSGRPLGEKAIVEIIARHLCPVVKPEDVKDALDYWVSICGIWETMAGGRVRAYRVEEIRGPIPMPEVRS